MKRFPLLSLVLGFGLLQVPGRGQSQSAIQHNVTVTLKLVQVYVTDKQGKPVSDLKREEFWVSDNGETKILTEFEKHALALPAAPAQGAEEVRPVPTPADVPSSAAPLLNRKFFFLFDFVFTRGKGFRIARDAALRFLETGLVPTDEAALLTFAGGRSLDVRKFPTRDHGAVRSAIEALSISDLLDEVLPDLAEEPSVRIMSSGSTSARTVGGSPRGSPATRLLVGIFIWAVESLAQALRYEPGQKHLILYSTGIGGSYLGRGEDGTTNTDLGRAYADMCRELSAANVSVFPVNTRDPNPFFNSESATGVSALREMASKTGGRFLGFAVNAEKHMETVNAVTGTYYVLGYPINQSWDGKYHTIRVRVNRPGCEVHAQPGYFNPKPFPEYSALEKQIHLVDLALAAKPLSQDPIRFEMTALPEGSAPPGNLFAAAEVPVAALKEMAGKKVEVASLVFDALDQIVDSRREEVDLGASAAPRDRVTFFSALSVRPGNYKCRIVLRDLETGRAAVGGASMGVPEAKPGKLVLFPPLLLTPAAGTIVVTDSAGPGSANRPSSDSQDGSPLSFDTKRFTPLLSDTLKAGSTVLAAVSCAGDVTDGSKIVLTATLAGTGSGVEAVVPITVVSDRPRKGSRALLVKLDIPEMGPGRFVLTFVAADKTSGLTSRAARTYRIE